MVSWTFLQFVCQNYFQFWYVDFFENWFWFGGYLWFAHFVPFFYFYGLLNAWLGRIIFVKAIDIFLQKVLGFYGNGSIRPYCTFSKGLTGWCSSFWVDKYNSGFLLFVHNFSPRLDEFRLIWTIHTFSDHYFFNGFLLK